MKEMIAKSTLVLCVLCNYTLGEETVASYFEAAEQGNAEAQYILGQRYFDGDGIFAGQILGTIIQETRIATTHCQTLA